jgi:SAM-dependent methyltransferase
LTPASPTTIAARARRYAPAFAKAAARRLLGRPPAVGHVRFGDLRRTEPISRVFGFDRGQPIDRHYIDAFLGRHANDVRGRVLEIAEPTYTRRFGGDRVERVDVLHVEPGGDETTIVDDLREGAVLEAGAYDCVLITETLHLIYEVEAALATVHRILAPGGVLLAAEPGIAQISRYDADRWGDHWRFTGQSARRLVEDAFPGGTVTVETLGNVCAAVAFLHGLAAEDLRPADLAPHDPDYELVIGIHAVKR